MPFDVLCWNVGDSLRFTRPSIKKVLEHIRICDSQIVCLQEAKRPQLHDFLLKRYEYAAKNQKEGIWNNNIIVSKRPIKSFGSLPVGESFEEVLWAVIESTGGEVLVINCHLPIKGAGIVQRLECIEKIYEFTDRHDMPAIICGDMNTTIPRRGMGRILAQIIHRQRNSQLIVDNKRWHEDERYAFSATAKKRGFADSLRIEDATWIIPRTKIERPNLKLDWFMVRGLQAEASVGPYISDHRPILAKCTIKNEKSERSPKAF